MALRLTTTSEEDSGVLFLSDGDLASVLRAATRLVQARLESSDEVPAVLGTVSAELGVACGRLYEQWDAESHHLG